MRLNYTQFDIANRTARYLFERQGAVLFRPDDPFTFTTGRKSPMYVDTRLLYGKPHVREDIVRMAFGVLTGKVGSGGYQIIAGGETAGIPFAAWLASRAGKSFAYIRKAPKGFGRQAQIECLTDEELSQGRKVLLAEDLCSEGSSKHNFIQAIRQSGNVVTDVLVVFSYGCFGAASALAQDGVALHAMCDAGTLVAVAEDLHHVYTDAEKALYGLPSMEVLTQVKAFLAAPDAFRWSESPTPSAA